MSSWEQYYLGPSAPGNSWNRLAKLLMRDLYGQTHGGEKALAGMIPGYGYLRRSNSEYQKAEDYYKNTGTDPQYPADVSSLTTPTWAQVTGGMPKPRMARSMTQLYTPEIIEDLSGMYDKKREANRMLAVAGNEWKDAWHERNRRYDYNDA